MDFDSFWFVLLIVPVFMLMIFGVVLVFIFFYRKNLQRIEEDSRKLGRQLGFRVVPGSFWKSSKLTGRYNGKWETEIMRSNKSQGNTSVPVVRFVMVYSPRGVEPPRWLDRRKFLSVTEKTFFSKKLASASPHYNGVFSTSGELARELADGDVQARMLDLRRTAHCELKVFVPDSKNPGTVEFMTTRKFVGDAVFASKVLELLSKVAEKMDGLQHGRPH